VFSDRSVGAFIVLAVAFALIGAVLIPQAKAAPTLPRALGRRNPFVQYATLLKRSRVRTILLAVAVEGFLFFGAFPYFGAYLKHEFALTYTTIGLILAGFGLAALDTACS
jgi:predicted MFS family arabinose efflux permease